MTRQTYRVFLGLYPWDYRASFEREMLRSFDLLPERRRSVTKELLGLLIGAAREWQAKLTTDPMIRGRALPDVRMMRPVGITREVWFRTTGR